MTYQPPVEIENDNHGMQPKSIPITNHHSNSIISPVLSSSHSHSHSHPHIMNNNGNTTLSITNINSNKSPHLPGLSFGRIDSNNSNEINLNLSNNNSNTWEIMKDTKDIILTDNNVNNNHNINTSSDSIMNVINHNTVTVQPVNAMDSQINDVLNANGNIIVDVPQNVNVNMNTNTNGATVNFNAVNNIANGIDLSQIPPPPTHYN